ncbi:ABC transporter ATP-binding protein [Paracoccus sp. (in: a-proteobacteria)]
MTDIILQARNLSKHFGGFKAVNDVSLDVTRGSVHALIGPNGAGKTTTFNLLTRFLDATSGTIRLDGKDITRRHPADVAMDGMVRSFQISATFPHLTLIENVRIALQRREGGTFRFWRPITRSETLNDEAEQLLADVGLADRAGRLASSLSYGRKRALEIATTLALRPKLLLLDEPTSGMGIEDIAPITALINRLRGPMTVLMVEHNLSVVAELSDRITVLSRGEVLAEGTYAEVSTDPDVTRAYMGE